MIAPKQLATFHAISLLQVLRELLPILLLLLCAGVEASDGHICGTIEPPSGYSVLQSAGSKSVRLDSSGTLHCSCSEWRSGYTETVELAIVDVSGRTYARMKAAVYPCLSVLCSQQSVAGDIDAVEVSNLKSVDLPPNECIDTIVLHTTTTDGIGVVRKNEMHSNCSRNFLTIVLIAQSHLLHQLSGMSSGTLRLRIRVPFDMDRCAHAVKQDGKVTSQTVPFNVNKEKSRLPGIVSEHRFFRRDNHNTQPSFFSSYNTAQVAENSQPGTTVTVVQANDIDSGSNGDLTYTMEPTGNLISGTLFEIQTTTGEITTTGTCGKIGCVHF